MGTPRGSWNPDRLSSLSSGSLHKVLATFYSLADSLSHKLFNSSKSGFLNFSTTNIWGWIILCWFLPSGSALKNFPAVQETQVHSLGWEDPLEEETATHSRILALTVSRTEEPGGLQSTGHKELDTTERQGTSIILCWGRDNQLPCMSEYLGSTPGFYPLDVCSTPPPLWAMLTKLAQIYSKNHPQLRITVLNAFKGL